MTVHMRNGDFELIPADPRQFAIHCAAYRENVFFRQSWERRLAVFGADPSCYWMMLGERRIGGVSLKPNTVWNLYMEPPFTDLYRLLAKLKPLMISASDPTEPIEVHGILPIQSEPFYRLGFVPVETRRVMIRPTEVFDATDWKGLSLRSPTADRLEELAYLSYEAYSGNDRIGYPAENTLDNQLSALERYFTADTDEFLLNASSIVLDLNDEPVAFCLLSMWEDLPLVSNIAVAPEYRGKGIASGMLRKSLTALKERYEVVRLFVTVGNAAEAVYYNHGFHPGASQTTFSLPARSG
ncbi:GNAT family N-acetyltransferase [Paenibacillus hemerocallicola]|uniref:GNAT family N-acetyltransferase n=1 Tax=Paenibacillus hemerocallicola TaxID=1172614 RepID=A0A5C4T8S5_9BACL|nr:GNAT family N-acetyltransferase [Paenibacillus hemerocallicola]TNJ65478.1 GNAT family N-acetyltransferase [Paenibacillus hemerocallicola]